MCSAGLAPATCRVRTGCSTVELRTHKMVSHVGNAPTRPGGHPLYRRRRVFSELMRQINRRKQMAGFAPTASRLANRRSGWLSYIRRKRPICCAEQTLPFCNNYHARLRGMTGRYRTCMKRIWSSLPYLSSHRHHGNGQHLTTLALTLGLPPLDCRRLEALPAKRPFQPTFLPWSSPHLISCWRRGSVAELPVGKPHGARGRRTNKEHKHLRCASALPSQEGRGLYRPRDFTVVVWAVFSGSRLAVGTLI